MRKFWLAHLAKSVIVFPGAIDPRELGRARRDDPAARRQRAATNG